MVTSDAQFKSLSSAVIIVLHIFLLVIPFSSACLADTLLFIDGTAIKGEIITEDDERVLILTESMGTVEILRDRIDRIEYEDVGGKAFRTSDPDINSVMLSPTPATLPKGDMYFRSFELILLNYGYSLTNTTDLSIGALFPISSTWNFVSLGIKQMVLDRTRHNVGVAVSGNLTVPAKDASSFGLLTGIIGIGDPDRSLNITLGASIVEDNEAGFFYLVGADYRVSERIKLIAEFGNEANFIEDDDDENIRGVVNVGVRIFGEKISAALSGIRPIWDGDGDSFLAFPLVSVSVHF
jgi:hypothetical protein